MTTLITNGTVISPSGAVDMDVLIDGEQIVALVQPGSSALGSDLAVDGGASDRRAWQVRDPRRRRCAHAHGAAVRRHLRVRHLRDRHTRRRLGWHHDDHRLRRAARRRTRLRRPRGVARQGRRQLRDRLRLPHDRRWCRRRLARGDGPARQRRRHHERQALHGLPGRLPQRRRADPAGRCRRPRRTAR